MISRRTLLLDRFATLILALVLVASGALAIWWWSGESPFLARTDLTRIGDLVSQAWWPWASAAVGVLLILLGLRWIAAHLPHRRVSRLTLEGTDATGRLSVEGSRAIAAAADAFADTLGVRSAKGTVRVDRGQLVARIKAVIEPEADLSLIAARADELSSLLAHVIGRDDLRCSVELTVGSRVRSGPRVH